MNDDSWDRLLGRIRENNVVPIVGFGLLAGADGETSLQSQIATHLLRKRGKPPDDNPLPPLRELSEAVSRLNGTVNAQDLYDYVHKAIQDVTGAPGFTVPAPLRQLAEIADFRLFVTLTPDDLLERTLARRCSVNTIVHSPNLPTSEVKDLARDWNSRPGEVHLLYLFGKSRCAPMFAIHDEDMLEYAHNLIAHGGQVLSTFLGELQQRNLLLIGCNFPDWLSRFFLRATNQRRLSEKDKRAWLIDPLDAQSSLTCFLRSYSKEIEILSSARPAEFVAELHQRWMAQHGADAEAASAPPAETVPRSMFFISYSRKTDLPRAVSLYQALLKQGVSESEVWFDRKSIEPGQDYKRRITEGIRGCRYFLPLLSQAANVREEAFVFTEWDTATERLKGMNREFLLPVIVDPEFEPESYTTPTVAEWNERHLDFGHAPDGVPDGRLISKLKKLVRESRSAGNAS